ncbi:AI-2E family transporter [Carnobacteriaceae bacterium 52-44]
MQKTDSNKTLFKRLILRFIFFILLILLTIYGLPFFVQLFYPFILAFIVATLVNPLVNLVNSWLNRLKIDSVSSRNFITFILTIFILMFISLMFYLTFSVLIREIIGLTTSIQENWSSIVLGFDNIQNWFTIQIAVLPRQVIELLDNFTENILEFIQNFSRNLLNTTVATTSSIISRTSTFFLNFLTFFLSLYFMISDYNNIKNFIKKHMDKRMLDTISLLKNSTLFAVGGYIKTQFILAFIAFVFMFIAFIFYGQEYALILALILALVDLLPLVGTIAVLLPWGIFEWIIGDPSKGAFLVTLGIGFFLFRRVTEPKIMGTQTGLHPLLALISIYVGIEISGLWGALLGPLVMVILISVFRSGFFKNTFSDLKELYYKIVMTLE